MGASKAACRGFSLLEAMVALVIVALGMMAVNTQLNRYAAAAVYVEQKTLASWIATNKLTELSVGPAWPAVGDSDEDVEFAGQKWRCAIKVQETPDAESSVKMIPCPGGDLRLGGVWPLYKCAAAGVGRGGECRGVNYYGIDA